MITLGLETSCDETSAAVVRRGRVLSNVVVSSLGEHRPFGGVVPEIASRSHLEGLWPCLERALRAARVKLADVDLVAVTRGPGLLGSLLVGVSAAKALSLALSKPLVGVDHVVAHAYSGLLADPGLELPYLALVVSGGHTVLLRLDAADRVALLGGTLDDAAGEAFDKVAKILGLGYPGGPEIDRVSQGADRARFRFKRPTLSNESLDFSFSGIKTAVLYTVRDWKEKGRLTARVRADLAASFQEAVCEGLVRQTLRAAERHGLTRVVVGGGVSANRRLRESMLAACAERGVRAVFPDGRYCQDNAAMIALLGEALHRAGRTDGLEMAAYSDAAHGPIGRVERGTR